MEDRGIVDLLFSREEQAICLLRDTYGSYCSAVARNILDSPEDIEEVLSDTWLRVWNSIPPERPRNLKLYLARITRNLSYDRFRSLTRQKRGGGEVAAALEELAHCIPGPEQPGDILEARELQRAVNVFLSALPRRDREIFLRRYFYIESCDAIAARCGIRPTLVRTVLSRTRKKLKDYLEKEGLL